MYVEHGFCIKVSITTMHDIHNNDIESTSEKPKTIILSSDIIIFEFLRGS